jgi:tRNA threonylcarbamoyladenosine biosynthesis protein TsaB
LFGVMLCLPELLREHAPLLLLDAASLRIQAGVLAADGSSRWATREDEAGIAVFRCVEQLDIDLASIGAFVFCEGPGSILGIRTVAMAIRTWQTLKPRPAFAYGSLAMVANAIGKTEVTVIADARRDTWHTQRIGTPLHRVSVDDLTGELITPEPIRRWSNLPSSVLFTDYAVEHLVSSTRNTALYRPITGPDAFLHQEPSFVAWSPKVHRAAAD